MRKNDDYIEIASDILRENKYLKAVAYLSAGILVIWIAGKATLLLSDATKNFKLLSKVLKDE